jgi:hypothetical protein
MEPRDHRQSLGKRVSQISRSRTAPRWLVLQPSLVVTLEIALVLAGMNGQVHVIKAGGRIRQIRTLYSETEADRRALRVAAP